MHDEPRIMSQIAKLLERLDAPARSRVIGWTICALDVQVPRPASSGMVTNKGGPSAIANEEISHTSFARLGKFSPATEDWLLNEQDYTIL
jgi:hypothetical protein